MVKKRRSPRPSSRRESHRSVNDENETASTNPKQTNRKGGRRHSTIRRSSSKCSVKFGVNDSKLRTMVEDEGLSIVTMSSDGNCLFRALSDQLLGDCGNKHGIIRAEICDFMEENEEKFKLFLVFEDDEGNNSEDAADFESYIDSMRRDGTWGGNLELVAAARLYRRNITVYSATLSAFTIDHDKESTGPRLLVSFHSGDHYNSVHRNSARAPEKAISRSRSERRPSRRSSRRSSSISSKRSSMSSSRRSSMSRRSSTSDTVSRRSSTSDTVTTSASTTSASRTTRSSLSDTVTTASASTISTMEESLSELSINDGKEIPLATVVGVNDKPIKEKAPCPCGSGRRYKKCCLAKLKIEAKLQKQKQKNGGHLSADTRQDGEESKIVMQGKFRVLRI